MTPVPSSTALGLTLQFLREQTGLSINALGKASGVDAAYIWRMEQGVKKDPSVSILRKICSGLEIAPQQFLTHWFHVESALERNPALQSAELDPILRQASPMSDEAIFAQVIDERLLTEQSNESRQLHFANIRLEDLETAGTTREVPIYGRIAAGGPIDTGESEVVGHVEVSATGLPKDPALFVLDVQGDSMVGDGILPGDRVVVSPAGSITMTGGQIAACLLYGSEVTLKHLWRTDSGYLLRASNVQYPDLEAGLGDCEVLGVVVRVLKAAETPMPV